MNTINQLAEELFELLYSDTKYHNFNFYLDNDYLYQLLNYYPQYRNYSSIGSGDPSLFSPLKSFKEEFIQIISNKDISLEILNSLISRSRGKLYDEDEVRTLLQMRDSPNLEEELIMWKLTR